jgi:putative MATE family efflux protein
MSQVLKGNISSYILKQSAVLLLGVLLMASFMLIDVYFISQLGSEALAAVSYATPIMSLLVSLLLGIGAGIVVVVSNTAGGGNSPRLHKVLISSFSFSLLFGFLLLFALVLGSEYLFRSLGAEGVVLEHLLAYFDVLSMGMFFLCLLVAFTSLARALGNHKLLTYTMLVLVAVNALLDPLLIFGYLGFPQLGIAGAAWATTIAIMLSMWVPVPYLLQQFPRHAKSWKVRDFMEWRQIMAMAFPIALANMLVPLGNTFFVRMLSTFGDDAVAAYGAGSRIDMLVIFSFTALTAVLAPFVGQNLGAGQPERAQKGVNSGLSYVFLLGVVAALLATFYRGEISAVFATEDTVGTALGDYLSIVPWGYAANGFVMVSLTVINVYQKPWWATSLAICHICLFYLPLTYMASELHSFEGVLAAYPVSHMMAAGVSYYLLSRLRSHKMMEVEFSG